MIDDTLKDAKKRMDGAVQAYERDLAGVRTNRASPGLVSNVKVDYHGTEMPLDQIAQITVGDTRMLIVQPWDKTAINMISKAIQASDVGMAPNVDGDIIRLNLPPLTEERRRDIVKMVRQRAEEAKIAVRNVRRDAIDTIRDIEKEGECSQDDSKRAQTRVQTLTDEATASIDKSTSAKEAELMQV